MWGQENPLDQVHTPSPVGPKKAPEAPGAADTAPSSKVPRLRVTANLVLVPMTVTDPANRLVTGLEAPNFEVFDNNVGQLIKSFSTEDAPVTIGIVFDLSGSMQSKFGRARRALSEFLRTSNPADEFFVVGFNDKPALIVANARISASVRMPACPSINPRRPDAFVLRTTSSRPRKPSGLCA